MGFSKKQLFKRINEQLSYRDENYIRGALEQIDLMLANEEVTDSFCDEYFKLKRNLEFIYPNLPNVVIGIITSIVVSLALEADMLVFIVLIAIGMVLSLWILFNCATKQGTVLEPYLLKKMEEKINERSKTAIIPQKHTSKGVSAMKKYIIGTTVLVVLVTTLLMVLDIFNITQYFSLSHNYDWLSYFATIVGAFVTISGIYITIRHERKLDQEKSRVENMPLFEYSIRYNPEDFDNTQGQLSGEIISHINLEGAAYNIPDTIEWHYNLLISNIGLGHGLLESIHIDFGDYQHKFIQSFDEMYTYKIVKLNEQRSIKFLIYAPAARFQELDFLYSMIITIKYKDLLGNYYTQKLHSCISYSKVDSEDDNSGFPSADLHYYENFIYTN